MIFLESFNSVEIEYKKYLSDHIKNVKNGYEYFKENLPEYIDDLEIPKEEMDKQIEEHDKSKYSDEEFIPYAEYYYGENKHKDTPEFEVAWEHHYKNNPHHPEYWGKNNDMPLSCIIEMICDWWSFSWKADNKNEIFTWWKENKSEKEQYMSDATLSKVEEILEHLQNSLQKYSCITNEKLMEALKNFNI